MKNELYEFKHTLKCKKCNKIYRFDNLNEVEDFLIEQPYCSDNYPCDVLYLGILPVNTIELLIPIKKIELMELVENENTVKKKKEKKEKLNDKQEIAQSEVNEYLDFFKGCTRISNKQMIPALKYVLDHNDLDGLNNLLNQYTEIYESSVKYLSSKYKCKLEKMLDY